jgi:hypothetical protein
MLRDPRDVRVGISRRGRVDLTVNLVGKLRFMSRAAGRYRRLEAGFRMNERMSCMPLFIPAILHAAVIKGIVHAESISAPRRPRLLRFDSTRRPDSQPPEFVDTMTPNCRK